MGQLYAVFFGHQPQKITVRIERPNPPSRINFDARLVVAVKRGFSHTTALNAINKIDGLIANPLNRHHFNGLTANNPAD